MLLDNDSCYRALAAHDPRFDGVFFVGVSTTGIYCRTICPARTPRQDRCAFFPNAAAAERAGYRPCLRCRPELAPGRAQVDAVERLAAKAARRIENGALGEISVAEMAGELGVSERHLRRAVESEFGVSPIELAQTQRLLAAKQLLTDTRMTITEVAFASGFASLRRFNALFKERYRMSPSDLRRRAKTGATAADTLVCDVAYRPPYDWPAILSFLGDRAAVGVEAARDSQAYLRTVRHGKHCGWLMVSPAPGKDALRIELSASLAPAFVPIVARVKRLFDLAACPEQIATHLGALAEARPGLRVPGAFDGFEVAVRAILGQQVSVAAATTLASRMAAAFGDPIDTPLTELTTLTPTPERIASLSAAEITPLGVTSRRAESIIALARAVDGKLMRLEPGADVEQTIARLKALPGIGDWTAQYVAMRALAWPDAFPHGDLGIVKALGAATPADALRQSEPWRPWRAYAAMHLWESLKTT